MVISKNIKKYREEKGLSQTELANELGYDRSTVAKWENGSLKPFAETLNAIANVLDVPIERFYEQ